MNVPLGKREDQRLEFKGRQALERPEKITREVVAMLNAEGGEVWVGVAEDAEVANEIEPIADADKARSRLFDHMVATIEPSPESAELSIEVVHEGELAVLRIQTNRGPRGPYAQLHNNLYRYYPLRVDSRIRLMTREELRERFGKSESSEHELKRRAANYWDEELKTKESHLWVLAMPEHSRDIDLGSYLKDMERYVHEPPATGNRELGFNFHTYEFPSLAPHSIVEGKKHPFYRLELHDDGRLVFRARLSRLEKPEGELFPSALAEFPASMFRLATAIYKDHQLSDSISCMVDFGLVGIGGRTLRGGSPGTNHYDLADPRESVETNLRAGPLLLPASTLIEAPDRAMWSLLTRIYQGFGLRRSEMPLSIWNDERGELTLR